MTSAEVRDQSPQRSPRPRWRGFPTGLKWTTVARPGDQKYVICTRTRATPARSMDRSVLESDRTGCWRDGHAAFAVHATEGYVYCRAEYPLARRPPAHAIRMAQRAGWLGTGIADTSFALTSRSALAPARSSVARRPPHRVRRGPSRHAAPRPPYRRCRACGLPDAHQQRRDVRQRANDPAQGPRVVRGIGVGKSTGTKVFASAGRIVNTGLVEVPMGMTCARSCTTSAAGSSTAGRSRPSRPAARRRLHPGRAPRHAAEL